MTGGTDDRCPSYQNRRTIVPPPIQAYSSWLHRIFGREELASMAGPPAAAAANVADATSFERILQWQGQDSTPGDLQLVLSSEEGNSASNLKLTVHSVLLRVRLQMLPHYSLEMS